MRSPVPPVRVTSADHTSLRMHAEGSTVPVREFLEPN